MVGIWITVCNPETISPLLPTFRPLRMFKIVFRNSSLYPKQLSLFCLLWLISANFAEKFIFENKNMTSQTTYTKYKWHNTPLNETPPWKFSAYATDQNCQLECTKCWLVLVVGAYHSHSRTLQFHAFYEVWFTARFDVLFKSLVTKTTINIFLHIFALCKSYKSFQCYWASCLHTHPYQNVHWYPLTRWWMHPSNIPCWPLHTYPSSLQCNFCIPDRLVTIVLWHFYVMQLSSAFSQSIFRLNIRF